MRISVRLAFQELHPSRRGGETVRRLLELGLLNFPRPAAPMFIPDIFVPLLESAVLLLYGALSYRAIESPNKEDDTQWLTFWLVYSLVTMAKAVLDYVSILVPFYHEIWLGLMLWLGLLHGADWVYKNILRPVAKQHEDKIDYVLARGKSVEALIKSAEKKA